jgi:tetratricopeptide (TPR) repeat protein
VCKNCGEENSVENSECFSCGIPLRKNKTNKKSIVKENIKNSGMVKSSNENYSKVGNKKTPEKILTSLHLLMFSSIIIIVLIFVALIKFGVFDSEVKTNITQINEQSTGSGVNLANLDEISDLESKVTANPDDLESTLHLAHLLQDSGLLEKAITNYKKYLVKYPENADARVDMAICYYNLGDNTTAISEMETALKYQPKHQIAHLNLGIVNLTARNIEASKEWFRKTADLDPNSEAGKRAQELLSSH